MFLTSKVRSAMRKKAKKKSEDMRDSPRFEVPLFVKSSSGEYIEHFGCLGINGFLFETEDVPLVGQIVQVKIVLHGMGMEIETKGRVIEVYQSGGFVKVAARFEEIPFESERMIARWLDLLTFANKQPAAA